MAFLTPDRVRRINVDGTQLEINERIIPDSARAPRQIASWVPAGGPMKPNAPLGGNGRPRGITIHNTNDINVPAGTNPAEQYSRATWPNANMRGVVVHFYIWRRDIWQILSLTERGWHASDGSGRRPSNRPGQQIGGNMDTIALEIIGNHPETEETAAMLTAWLLKEFDLEPPTDLYTHNFFMGLAERIVPGAAKNCPLYILPHWGQFKDRVAHFYNMLVEPAPKPVPEPDQDVVFGVVRQVMALIRREDAEIMASRLNAERDDPNSAFYHVVERPRPRP